MKRALVIVYKDGSTKELELSKATSIKADIGMFHMDKLPDGKWRLTFTNEIANEFKDVERIDIKRED